MGSTVHGPLSHLSEIESRKQFAVRCTRITCPFLTEHVEKACLDNSTSQDIDVCESTRSCFCKIAGWRCSYISLWNSRLNLCSLSMKYLLDRFLLSNVAYQSNISTNKLSLKPSLAHVAVAQGAFWLESSRTGRSDLVSNLSRDCLSLTARFFCHFFFFLKRPL